MGALLQVEINANARESYRHRKLAIWLRPGGRAMIQGRLRWWVLSLALALTAGCGCGGNEEAIARVHRLPRERLAKLVQDVAAIPDAQGDYRGERIPAAFSDLAPKSISIRHGTTTLYLSGCFDDQVSLIVRGANGHGTPTIWLLPGEAQPGEVLWMGGLPVAR